MDVFFDAFQIQQVHSKVVQSDDYYPFGLTFNSYKRENSLPNMIQYNGKEKQDELNLEWLDYGARMYMPEVARWGVVDALADRYEGISPYAYTLNDPVNAVDPDGNLIIFVNGLMKNQWSSSDNQKYVTYKMRGERDVVENPNYRPYPGERSFNRNAPTYLNQPFSYWGNEAIAGRSFTPHGGVGGLFSQIYDDKNSLSISASADNNSQASDRFAEGIKAADDLIRGVSDGRFMGRKYHRSGMGGHYAETWVRDIVKWATDNGIKITV